MIENYGFQVPKHAVATTASEAAAAAVQIGFPVALKVISPIYFIKPKWVV